MQWPVKAHRTRVPSRAGMSMAISHPYPLRRVHRTETYVQKTSYELKNLRVPTRRRTSGAPPAAPGVSQTTPASLWWQKKGCARVPKALTALKHSETVHSSCLFIHWQCRGGWLLHISDMPALEEVLHIIFNFKIKPINNKENICGVAKSWAHSLK